MKIVVAATALLALAASGCSASTVNTSADKTEASGSAAASTAKLGQPVTIKGNEKGSKVQVVATKFVGRTKSTDGFSAPEAGSRLVAVQFSFVNTGTAPYDDAPCNGAKVVDKAGQQFDCDITFSKVAAGPVLPASTKLAPGNKALGFLVFQVPEKAKMAQIQFSQDSGFGETAQWSIR